ncbi:MAG: hypothetical protein HY096_09695 [Nitrospinae bacterium]|nr:hypothetical protein [Nitrospinota bacterium]
MVTVADLKLEIKEYNYQTLVNGDDAVAERCIQNAALAIKAALRSCGVEPDWTDDIDRAALIKLSLYELYSYAENEAIAADKKKDAFDLLRGKYGNCVGKGISLPPNVSIGGRELGDPVVHVEPGSDNWKGYK